MNGFGKFAGHIGRTALLKASVLIMILAFAIITQTGCGDKEFSETGFALNTTCTVTVSGLSGGEADEVLDEAFDAIYGYEELFSRTMEGSDIYRINHAAGSPVEVSDDTIAVLEQALEMGEISGGKFDITVGRLVEMWDFQGEDPAVPPADDIAEAVMSVDQSNVEIDGNRVRLTDPGAEIDLGGIAKGYIADRLCGLLEEKGVESAVINLGGNVETMGSKAGGKPWTVGIERPYSDRSEIMGSVELSDGTLVTSGIYERNFEEEGVLYHHVLDPDTGYPADTDLESVTIMAAGGNSAFCDGLSTTCLLLGKDRATELVDELRREHPDLGIEAAFIDKDGEMVQTVGMEIAPPK